MKVCQLCAIDFTLKNFLLPLIDGMASRGWEVEAVCSDGPAVEMLRERGYRIKPVQIARSMNPISALRSMWELIKLFRRERYDVLHVHTPVAALIGRLAAKIAGIPYVIYTAHGFYFHEDMPPAKFRFFLFLEQMAGKWCDLLFTQSAEDAATAVAEKIMPADRVLAIGNGVDINRFDPSLSASREIARRGLGIPEDAYVIGMIGRQVREKGVGEFLQAGRILAANSPHLWLLLVGDRLASDHAASVDADFAAAQSALGERLVAPGLSDNIPDMLAAMDVFCLPSWREGMPRTIIEAMLMGLPVLATDIRGSREEVVHEQTGILVPVRDPVRLAEAMKRCMDGPEWAASLGAAGRDRAIRLYDEAKVVQLQLDRVESEARERGLC